MARPILAKLGARSIEIPLDGDGLPAAFRLFKAGANETTKGTFLFDEEAARSVMEAATGHGVDLMLDLEHLSLDQESNAYDPDARAWFRLEVRDGELWAVDVRWTDDGARRLKERTQRYISPAFAVDEDGRVIEIVNVALVAMPATHGTAPLVAAANRRARKMTPYVQQKFHALSAEFALAKRRSVKLAEGEADGAAPAGKFAAIKSAAADAEAKLAEIENASGDVDSAMAAVDAAVAAVESFVAAVKAMGGSDPAEPAEPAAEPAAEMSDTPEDKDKQLARERAKVVHLRKLLEAAEHEKEITRLAAESARRSGVERKLSGRQIVVTPGVLSVLSKHLPIDALEMLDAAAGSVPVALGGPVAPIVGGGDGSRQVQTTRGVVTLTANQLRECERTGAKPEAFAELIAGRAQATTKRN